VRAETARDVRNVSPRRNTMKKTRRLIASLCATGLLTFGVAAPASAQPVVTGGLINITLVDVLSGNNVAVQVPVGIAANVCDVNAAVLLAAVRDTGSARCDADADSIAWAMQKQR
jgi:CBS-domain-containing membrane protein